MRGLSVVATLALILTDATVHAVGNFHGNRGEGSQVIPLWLF